MENKNDLDVFFTSSMFLSKEADEEVRKMIPHFIQSVMTITGPSDSEVVRCLTLDWFEF
jgi:hypothetical protein